MKIENQLITLVFIIINYLQLYKCLKYNMVLIKHYL